jgi:hypothetical protein
VDLRPLDAAREQMTDRIEPRCGEAGDGAKIYRTGP